MAVAGLVACGALAFTAARQGERLFFSRRPSHPNVLLITIDTLRWDHVGCYGARRGTTPVLDGLAAKGVRFETAVMHTPLTAPSHATILTGLTPLRHGVRDNGAFALPTSVATLATTLKDAGYATAAFVSGFPLDRRFGFSRGFDTYDDRLPRGGQRGISGASGAERRADRTTALALAWLDARAGAGDRPEETRASPWFLWVHYFDPHAPYEPPAEWLARFPGDPYDGEIAFTDQQIGRLLERLDPAGALVNTLVLVTADHGESLDEHGEETHGVFVYDATVRVPLVVAGPNVPRGRVAGVVARGVDVMPTLLDLAGVSRKGSVDGRSLRPALEGNPLAEEPAYLESLLSSRHFGWAELQAWREGHWKYIAAPSPELYDLASDPAESTNVIDVHADRAAAMSRALASDLRASSLPDASRPLDRETRERLSSLGYLARTPSPVGAASRRDPKSAVGLINRIEHAIAGTRLQPERAAGELRAVLAEDPGIAIARSQLAAVLASLGDHKGAVEQIRTLEGQQAATPDDLLLLSESLRLLGRADDAARALAEAARLDPRSPEPALTEARARMAAGETDRASAAFDRALALAPGHPEALVGLGTIAFDRGDLATASGYFERVLAQDPGDLAARTRLGMLRGRQGRLEEAIAMLRGVVQEAPADGEALAGLGAALARSGAPAAAVPYFERAVNAGLRTPAVLNGLGFARLEAGDRPGALAALRASLALRADQPGVARAVQDLSAGTSPRPAGDHE